MLNKDHVNKLRDLPIEAVAQRLGLEVSHHTALCPFHADNNPSLRFRARTNSYKCFVCGESGNSIDLVMKMLNKNFKEACNWLADENNIITERYVAPVKPKKEYPPDTVYLSSLMQRPVLSPEAQHFLFEERKLSPVVVAWVGISSIDKATPCWRYGKPFYDAPSLLIPYKDWQGNIMNVQSRYLGKASGIPRFRFPSNSSIHIFNLPILRHLRPCEALYISEGVTDCLALMSAGHKAIAIPSATLLRKEDLAPFTGREWHIFPDQDEAGERLYRHLVAVANELRVTVVRHQLPQGCKDYSDYYMRNF